MKDFKIGDKVIVFNCIEWNKTMDLPNGNDMYYQVATILNLRKSSRNEPLADVLFENGLLSNGHFTHGISLYNPTK